MFPTLERAIEMELEAGLEEVYLLQHCLRFGFAIESVQDEEVSDEIDEDEGASACTESHMLSGRLELKATTHGTFDVVHLIGAERRAFVQRYNGHLVVWNRSLVNTRCKPFRLIVCLQCQADRSLILPKHR